MMVAYDFVSKSNIVDFVKIIIRLEFLCVWDFGLGKLQMYFILELKKKKKKPSNKLFMKLVFVFTTMATYKVTYKLWILTQIKKKKTKTKKQKLTS